jgi:tRNA threonylcarbamoyladenosine biosynthesis protein TsaB
MITLAIECATDAASAALLSDGEIVGEICLGAGRHHSETVLKSLDFLLKLAGKKIEDVDLLACTRGPGSFTGVRIGIATVKGLALATGKPIVAVSTLETLAMNLSFSPRLIAPLLDARRNQVYAGLYRMKEGGLPESLEPDYLAGIDVVLQRTSTKEVDFIGNGALAYQKSILENNPASGFYDARKLNHPLASSVGLLAFGRFCQGCKDDDPFSLLPTYLRLSEAEQKMDPGVEIRD